MNNNVNPFSLFLNEKQFENLEKDFLYRQMISFIKLKEYSDMMNRLRLRKPISHDFEIRDFFATGLFPNGL